MSAQDLKAKGGAAFKAGNFEEAVDHFTAAIDLTPEDQTLYSNRSASYLKLTILEEALADAQKCIELKPDWVKGYQRKGHALQAQEKSEEAK